VTCPQLLFLSDSRRISVLPPKADAPLVDANARLGRPARRHQKKSTTEWIVSFMQYDLGYIDLEQKTLQPPDNPFERRVLPFVPGMDHRNLAEREGFEPPLGCPKPDFESGAFDHSAISPQGADYIAAIATTHMV
jgi:hypothetical protein